MNRIVIEKRNYDYMASLKGNKKLWGCGNTVVAAIGSLIWNHKECFDIELDFGEIINKEKVHNEI